MERREHYDPEDIENLLQERSFDELLEEERAYVLRHLSGREEYEAMRALLGHVREDDRRREPLTADRAVRDNVMAAYRANLRPTWQVWLNSIGQALWPKEMSAMWRPALALGSLALLITAGLWFTRSMEHAQFQPQVAELKKEVEKPSAPPIAAPSAQEAPAADGAFSPAGGTVSFSRAESADSSIGNAVADMPADESVATLEEEREGETTRYRLATKEANADDANRDKDAAEPPLPAVEDFKAVTTTGAVATAPVSHVVTEAEFEQNQSLANVTTVTVREMAKRKFEKKADVSASLAANPDLLALLTTGW